jgi:hypothetical protein
MLLSWLMLLSASALGQSSKAIPRLNDGKPDMQGYWTNQTFTPLERPAQYKGKEYLPPRKRSRLPSARSTTSGMCRAASR